MAHSHPNRIACFMLHTYRYIIDMDQLPSSVMFLELFTATRVDLFDGVIRRADFHVCVYCVPKKNAHITTSLPFLMGILTSSFDGIYILSCLNQQNVRPI